VHINKVALHPARLVPRWATAGVLYWYVASHPGQLSLLPSAGWALSTNQSVMMLCGWETKADMAHSTRIKRVVGRY